MITIFIRSLPGMCEPRLVAYSDSECRHKIAEQRFGYDLPGDVRRKLRNRVANYLECSPLDIETLDFSDE